ncbi:DUF1460 domain-containing protein [Balneolales bacterium ANBcel1]|nr:DUF1460 domain-containing protein [Balneolales bacterium ANBcel1]
MFFHLIILLLTAGQLTGSGGIVATPEKKLIRHHHTGSSPDSTLSDWLDRGWHTFRQDTEVPALISFYAEQQMGLPYVDGLLDQSGEEQLVVTLDGTDCVIYVEMALALALAMTTLGGSTSVDDFRSHLEAIRYREGRVDGYGSRLHYFSDWLMTNDDKGLLTLLFQDEDLPAIGPVRFMSENRERYRHLAENERNWRMVRATEKQLDDRVLRYIPADRIPEFESRFQSGDVLAFVTTIDKLDISHTGLVLMDGDRAGFYHASLTGSVITDPGTIYEYVRRQETIKGIVIARLSPS